MRQLLWSMALASLLPTGGFASTGGSGECSLNFAEFRSPLDAGAKHWKSIQPVAREETKHLLTQTAVLKSGEGVEFRGGGCEHLAYSFTYSRAEAGSMSSAVQKALQLLKKTPVTADREEMRDVLVRALESARKFPAKDGEPLGLPCGADANCTLATEKGGRLRVSYDFAL